ncbi:hypothetical protein SNE40_020016 [Patella caerulea]|uniref:Phospholipase A2 n=1 Tax=Patella caerulea TaxID=87958 RepID=A0AAN8J017_PATCE
MVCLGTDHFKKIILFAMCTVFFGLSVISLPLDQHREKRTIFQLCGLINFYTERSCWDYNDYGCFCGLGNSGHKPVDDADACCRKHDNCYGSLACYWYIPQWTGYEIQCNNSTCTCLDDTQTNACARSVCECDVNLASCLKDAGETFSDNYRNYNRHLCSRPNFY